MRNYIELGSCPYGEDCAQVGSDNYRERALKECARYISLLIEEFGPPPEGCDLRTKCFPHDFGNYYEVVCYYDDKLEESVDYAFGCESGGPEFWESN
jgi:hypothetical protein